MPVIPTPASQPSRSALVVPFGVVFINLVGFGIVVPLLPFHGLTLDAPPWQVALMFSAYSLGQPLWGRLSDRIGCKPVLLITVMANAAGYLALAIFSGLGHDWPFLIGAALTIPAAVMALNAGRAFRRRELRAAQPAE